MKIDRLRNVVQESRFDYKEFPCVVLFSDMGHRCGYVGIPEGSGINIDEISCHGGITYGPSSYLHLQDDENIEWIGFDTAHYGDGRDIEKVKEYFPDRDVKSYTLTLDILHCMNPPIRSLEFCEEECRKIVDQVINMLREDKEKQL